MLCPSGVDSRALSLIAAREASTPTPCLGRGSWAQPLVLVATCPRP